MRQFAALFTAALLVGSAVWALAAGDTSAGSATKVQATQMSDAQIRQTLESLGYTNVRVTERGKGHVDATATKNGKAEKLAVNPQSGQIIPDTDKDD